MILGTILRLDDVAILKTLGPGIKRNYCVSHATNGIRLQTHTQTDSMKTGPNSILTEHVSSMMTLLTPLLDVSCSNSSGMICILRGEFLTIDPYSSRISSSVHNLRLCVYIADKSL